LKSRFLPELRKMLILNIAENEMQEYEKLQMEICILKFVLSQIINIAVNEMIYM
jgi:hypothetical protein